jgi:hypothetical protein
MISQVEDYVLRTNLHPLSRMSSFFGGISELHQIYQQSVYRNMPALSQPLKGNEIVRRKGMFPVDGLSEDNPIVLEDKAVVVKDFFGWLTRLK